MAHNLDELIKHQPPMRLIDELCWAEPGKGQCRLTVGSDNLFYSESLQGLPAHVGMELMAQSIAAVAGYQHKAAGGEIKLGFLLGSRKYQCDVASFKLGERYDVFVEELHVESSGLSVFECDIRHGDKVIAQARLNVYQPPDENAFIEENYG
jgi:predicted hotdog family 3-hydroxylacyl-ACP dehydratase